MSGASTVVLWHSHDAALARALVQGLEQEGFSVDGECAAPGPTERASAIARAVARAGCVIALWSKASTGPSGEFMQDQAVAAKERGVLIGLGIETVLLSPQLEGMRLVELGGWRGSRNNSRFRELVAAVRAIETVSLHRRAGGGKPFYRRLAANLTLGGVVLGLCGFAMNLFGVQREICAIPSRHVIADGCGALGLGGQPDRSERLAFESRPPGNCDALRRLRPQLRSDVLKEEASQRLSAPIIERSATFSAAPRTWGSYVRARERPLGSRAQAMEDALVRAREDAATMGCAPRDAYERLAGVDVTPLAPDCSADPRGGFRCGLNYSAQCRIEVRALVERCW